MKKSGKVIVGLAAVAGGALLLGVTGCSKKYDSYQHCVDKSGKVVDDKYCGSGGGYTGYRWFYSHTYYRSGAVVDMNRGSFNRPTTGTVGKASSRGGFGRSSTSGS